MAAKAREQAVEAQNRGMPDEVLDDLSVRLLGVRSGRAPEHPEFGGAKEFLAAITAVVASAPALEGSYGSIEPLANPPSSTAARKRQIIEAFKLGFAIGGHTKRWMTELDWPFDLRDRAVPR
jgi:hypothetical protein